MKNFFGHLCNYAETFESADLTINKADLTISAQNSTSVYGSDPQLNATLIYSVFMNGDDENVLDELPTVSTSAMSTSSVGTYAAVLSGGSDNNYNYVLHDGMLEVTPATLTVTAENKTKTYGEDNPELHVSYSGFVNGEGESVFVTVPVATTDVSEVSDVGNYVISVSGGEADNYILSYSDGSFTITKTPLTLTADDKTMNEGATVPELTMSAVGFVNGDDLSSINTLPTLSTDATPTSSFGSYEIFLVGGDDNNYSMNLINGVLTIHEVLGLDEEEIAFYPNPTLDGKIFIANASLIGKTYKVMDTSGRVVKRGILEQELTIESTSGIYVLVVPELNIRMTLTKL